MGRAARTMLVLLVTLGASVVVAPSASAGVSVTASLDVEETLAGTQDAYAFTITNTSGPSNDPMNHLTIRPSRGEIAIDDAAAEGWTATLSAGTATFRLGSLPSGATQVFYLLASALPSDQDVVENWNIKVSNQDGINQNSPPDPATDVRVLSVDSVDVVSPEGVLDYTGTRGQTITIESTISNYATVALNIDGKLTETSGDSKTELEDKILTPPGGSAEFHFSVVLGAPGTRAFLGGATDPTGNVALATESDDFEVAPNPAFTYRTGSLSPTASVSGASQVFSLSLVKADSPGVSFDTTQSHIKIESGPDKTFTSPLATPTYAEPGARDLGLTFAPVTIPNFSASSYNVWVKLVGEDDNGQLFSVELERIATFTKEDAMPYATPSIAAPQGQVDPDGMPVVKNGDTITLGGDIRTTAASGAPLDPTAQILDCDLAVLDPNLVRVSTIDVPLTQCQNVGGHFSGQVSPSSIGVTDGFLRLEAQVKKAVGGATSPPDQVSNLIAVDNDVPQVMDVVPGCAPDAGLSCDPFRTLRVRLSEPVTGVFSVADFVVSNHVLAAVGSNCAPTSYCDEVTLTLALPLDENEYPAVSYAPLVPVTRATDVPGHPLANTTAQSSEEFPAPPSYQNDETRAKEPLQDAVEYQATPSGRVLVTSANVIQAFGHHRDNSCPAIDPDTQDQQLQKKYRTQKECNGRKRRKAFAQRIVTLAGKEMVSGEGDGTGPYVPDVIVLQEVTCPVAESIADHLADMVNVRLSLQDPDPSEADYLIYGCSDPGQQLKDTSPPGPDYVKRNGAKVPIRVISDTAVLVLSQTMAPLTLDDADDEGASEVTKYGANALPDSCFKQRGDGSLKLLFLDADGNEENDCAIDYKRQFMLGLEEIAVDPSAVQVAVASTHFATPDQIKGLGDEVGDEGLEEKYRIWARDVARRMARRYQDHVDALVIGGDLNARRCLTQLDEPAEPDELSNSQACGERQWWDALVEARGYSDEVYRYHGSDDISLDDQYDDGCNAAPNSETGLCGPEDQREREKRIDFAFWKLLGSALPSDEGFASHDLTCGQQGGNPSAQRPVLYTCDHLINPERYSDHRLVWGYEEIPQAVPVPSPSPT